MDKLSEYRKNFRKTYQWGKFMMIAAFFLLYLLNLILTNLLKWKLV